MNIQLANVISDISGATGQTIIKAILKGERDSRERAAYRDCRVKASEDQWGQGHWERSHAYQQSGDQRLQNGAQFRRFRTRLGPPVATKAMAAKLARLVYRMLRYGMKYVDQGAEFYEAQYRKQQVSYLKRRAAQLGLKIIEATVSA